MVKVIIFDLDGTLIDAYKAIQKSLNFTLNALRHPQVKAATRVRRAVGYGDINFIKRFVKDKEIKKALKIYRRHHKTSLLKYSRILPEAKKILGFLKRKGYKLAVASNRPKKFSNILLTHLGLKKYFKVVRCGKNKDDIKPKPKLLLDIIKRLKAKKGEAIYVGDMAVDVYAGRNAGIKTIAILGGSSSASELRRARPFKIISKLRDLLKYL